MRYVNNSYSRFAITLLVLSAFAGSAVGQKLVSNTRMIDNDALSAPSASVAPVVFDHENIKCSDLNALHVNGVGDIRFSHIISDNELKLDFGNPNGTFPFTTGGGRIVVGPQDGTRTVSVVSSSNPGLVSSWSSQIQITAINVKVGNTSYIYPYKPFKMSDINLATGDGRGISHISFCFGDPTAPTAADGSISGRVIDASGNGIAKAQMVLVNGATGETRITMTSPFGYYTFTELDVNELYVVNVNHKRFAFAESQKVISLMDNLADIQFIASPQQ